MAQSEIKLTFNFDDETTRDIKLGPFDTDADVVKVETLRANAKAFSAANVKNAFVSEAGASCTGLTGATLIKIDEREFNLRGDA